MLISIIAAMDNDRVIGKNNELPWKLPRELQYVKKTTEGCPLIMGRKNHESIGRPLPGRRNIILTRNKDYRAEGCEVVHSVGEALTLCKDETRIFIFGGEEIYKLFLPMTDMVYLTKINHSFGGDAFFPELDPNDWFEVRKEKGITDSENPYEYHFHVYARDED